MQPEAIEGGKMSIRIETEDPGAEGIREEVERYRRVFPDYVRAIELYGAVMEVQQEALCEIECAADLSGVDVDERLKEGTPLLDPCELDIPPRQLRRVLTGICSAIEGHGAEGFGGCDDLLEREILGAEGLRQARDRLLRGERLELAKAGEERVDSEAIASIIWESLVPFYRKCASGVQGEIDHSLWQKGRCPVCGTGPLMGKLEPRDGLWLLECRLCHTLWNVRRAACPFCSRGEEGSLQYLYLEGHAKYRAYYCGQCGRYVKTVNLRSSQRDAVLPLENIVTEMMGLDRAAEQEGLEPA